MFAIAEGSLCNSDGQCYAGIEDPQRGHFLGRYKHSVVCCSFPMILRYQRTIIYAPPFFKFQFYFYHF